MGNTLLRLVGDLPIETWERTGGKDRFSQPEYCMDLKQKMQGRKILLDFPGDIAHA